MEGSPFVNDGEEFIVIPCMFCNETLWNPIVLPRCLHTFCEACIFQWLENETEELKCLPETFHCPECANLINIPDNGLEGLRYDAQNPDEVHTLDPTEERRDFKAPKIGSKKAREVAKVRMSMQTMHIKPGVDEVYEGYHLENRRSNVANSEAVHVKNYKRIGRSKSLACGSPEFEIAHQSAKPTAPVAMEENVYFGWGSPKKSTYIPSAGQPDAPLSGGIMDINCGMFTPVNP